MRARTASLFFILIIGTWFLTSCAKKQPIRIGFLADLSGPSPAVGVGGRDGALLAAAHINAKGGIDGRPLELVVRDAHGSPEGAAEAARQLIEEEKIFVILAHMTSGMTIAAWQTTQKSGALYLSPTASAASLTGLDDNFLRLAPPTSAFAERLGGYAAQKMGLKTFAALYDTDNAAFTETYKDSFKEKAASAGGKILWEHGFSSASKPDFQAVLQNLKGGCPEGILILASAADTAWLAQRIRLSGCDSQLLTSNWALTKDLVQNGGKAVEGILAVATHNEDNRSPEYLDFSSRFEERFKESPSFSAGYAYEAVLFLAQALKKTGGETEGLKAALLEIQNFNGVFGRLSLDAYGDVNRPLYLVTVRGGKFFTKAVFQTP